jgi:hypothetical protein
MLLSAVSVLVVALLRSEVLEGLMNYPVQYQAVQEVQVFEPEDKGTVILTVSGATRPTGCVTLQNT